MDLYLAAAVPNTYVVHTNATDMIFFALINHQDYQDESHYLFIKVANWAILKVHKKYLILFYVMVTKKQIQPYVGSIWIKEKVGHFTYKFEVSSD